MMFDLMPFEMSNKNMFQLLEDFDKKFGKGMESGFRTDILDKGDHFLLEAELPGFQKEDITIDLDGDRLVIRAVRSSDEEQTKKDYLHRERYYGEFVRRFHLANVNVDQITANYQDGVLKLQLPKKQPENHVSRLLLLFFIKNYLRLLM